MTGCCTAKDEVTTKIILQAYSGGKTVESSYQSMPRGIKTSQAWNSRSYDSIRGGEKPFQICAENIEYVITFIDP